MERIRGRERAHRGVAPPAGPGIRVDAGVGADIDLPTAYDPLLAKLMVHAADRDAAVARLRRALDETVVGGLPTTLGFHRWLVDQPAFLDGRYDTRLVDDAWGVAAAARERDRLAGGAGGGGGPCASEGPGPSGREPRLHRPGNAHRRGSAVEPGGAAGRSTAVDRDER